MCICKGVGNFIHKIFSAFIFNLHTADMDTIDNKENVFRFTKLDIFIIWYDTISYFQNKIWWNFFSMFSLVQFVVLIVFPTWSHVLFFASPWTVACKVSLSSIISWSLLKFLFFELVMPSNHLIFCCPLLLLPSIFPSTRVFYNESPLCIRWPKYWNFSFSINPLQHHNMKASVLQLPAFFMVQLAHLYMTTGKTIDLTYSDLCWQSDVFAFAMLNMSWLCFQAASLF